MTANPRSPIAILDVPFSDPFTDDGLDDEMPVVDLSGHMHFTSTSKGLRSALRQGKRSFDAPCPVAICREVNVDPYDGGTGGIDLEIRARSRTAEWFRGCGYMGPGITGSIQVRANIDRLALNNGGSDQPMLRFTDFWQQSIRDLAAFNGRGYAVVLGGKGLQCASFYSPKFGDGASLKLVGASQVALYSPMLERGYGSLPSLHATAGEIVSGPITIIDAHCERDDFGEAFRLVGFNGGVVLTSEFTYCRGVFERCSRIRRDGNYFKSGSRFEYIDSPEMAISEVTSRSWWGGWVTSPLPQTDYVDGNP